MLMTASGGSSGHNRSLFQKSEGQEVCFVLGVPEEREFVI